MIGPLAKVYSLALSLTIQNAWNTVLMFSIAANLPDVFLRIGPISGELCIDMPSVLKLVVQLTFPGPPATQYLPKDVFLGSPTLSPLSMLTKGLLGVLRCIQPVTSQDCFGRAKMAANFGLD